MKHIPARVNYAKIAPWWWRQIAWVVRMRVFQRLLKEQGEGWRNLYVMGLREGMRCEGAQGPCWSINTSLSPTATSYPHNKDGGGNPNHVHRFCPLCEGEYHDMWSDMWDEYYSGIC